MTAIIGALFNPILPIFAIAAIGFIFGRFKIFDSDMATTINRFVVMLALPALIFSFLATVPFEDFELPLIAAYFASSFVLYAIGFLVMRYGFRLGLHESILLGMAGCFVNHVYFVLYIATILYGESASLPVLSVITFDAFLIFGSTYLLMDLLVSGARSPLAAAKVLCKNPMLIAITAGLTVGLFEIPLHEGIITYSKFAGGAAAPASMFALGVVLSGVSLRAVDGPAMTLTGMKLILHPTLLMLIFMIFKFENLNTDPVWFDTLILTAAGPCGAMPFVIALQHKIDTQRIVKTIVYSTILSLFSLAVISAL